MIVYGLAADSDSIHQADNRLARNETEESLIILHGKSSHTHTLSLSLQPKD